MKKVTILVNSCDLYEDAWEPGLKLFKIQWPNCPYDFVLNTETKKYSGEIDNVKTVCYGKKGTWTERFRYVLEQIDSPYVLFTLEDYFLLNKVNEAVFEKAVSVMDTNPNVGMICLSQTQRTDIKTEQYEDDNFYSRIINEKCLIWCRICLYRRDYLLKLLRDHENIWEFEQYASYRAKKLNYIILQQNNVEPECFTFKIKIEDGYGITRRKWLPKNVELFKEHSIEVDFDRLGIYSPHISSEQSPSVNVKKTSGIREVLYNTKHLIKVIKKKFNKQYRKFKSIC